ncbi:MAG: hypothetical protein HS105_08645 [Chloracidobacterium sp.]|nr:hypothetical protein [Chloracidobacterium sp.]MCO5333531.1 hypothetical protein [Pyrinomonadaceae bacterium]
MRKVRPTAVRLLAVFFVLYVLADVSVLQLYCGNEALGIPPADHIAVLSDTADSVSADVTTFSEKETKFDTLDTSSPFPSELPEHVDAECFGGCSHIVVPLIVIDLETAATIKEYCVLEMQYDQYEPSRVSPLTQPPQFAGRFLMPNSASAASIFLAAAEHQL